MISKELKRIAKLIFATKWEKFTSKAKEQGWRRKDSAGNWEYRYQDNDPNEDPAQALPTSPYRHDKTYSLSEADLKSNINFENTIPSKQQTLGGSTGAFKIRDKSDGDSYVIKTYENGGGLLQIKTELLTNSLYKEVGILVPESKLTIIDGKPALKNEWIYEDADEDPEDMISLYADKGFVMDAWLANWDSIGLEKDNMIYGSSGLTRIDNGGALLFRAQGDFKGDRFNDEVNELFTLRDPKINPNANIFKHIKDKEIAKQILDLVKRLPDKGIKQMVESVFDREPEIADFITKKLINRKKWLINWAKETALKLIEDKKIKRKKRWNIGTGQIKSLLTDNEEAEIADYTADGYEDINKFLREELKMPYMEAEEYEEKAKELKKKVKTIVSGLEKLPVYTKPVYRGTELDESTMLALALLNPDDVIYMKAFTSTSADKNQIFDMAVKFTIYGKTGRSLGNLAQYEDEKEVLFAPDSRFKVKSIKHFGLEYNVELEEILDTDMPNKKPVNLNKKKKKLTASDIRTFLLKNTKLSPKQRARIQKLSEQELFKIAFAIFAKTSKSGKNEKGTDESQSAFTPSKKFTEIFI